MIHLEDAHSFDAPAECGANLVGKYFRYMQGSIQSVDCPECRKRSWEYTEALISGEHTLVELVVFSEDPWYSEPFYKHNYKLYEHENGYDESWDVERSK